MERPTGTLSRSTYSAVAGQLLFGVSTPGGLTAARELQYVADAVRRRPQLVMGFEDFFATPPVASMAFVAYCGADPIVTWEPWCWTNDRSPAVIRSLLAGALDDYIYRWADEIRDWGSTVYLRFAHEFNGHWYPWTPACGTSADQYVEAWRRLHDIFSAQSAHNAKWVWAPTVGFDDGLDRWYPGDDYVDVLGVDGYNWGVSSPSGEWVEPDGLFGPTLETMREIDSHKPILVTEVGCADQGGCKADWIAAFIRFLRRQPDAMGFIWFEHDKETDWRMASTSTSAAAMARALRAARTPR